MLGAHLEESVSCQDSQPHLHPWVVLLVVNVVCWWYPRILLIHEWHIHRMLLLPCRAMLCISLISFIIFIILHSDIYRCKPLFCFTCDFRRLKAIKGQFESKWTCTDERIRIHFCNMLILYLRSKESKILSGTVCTFGILMNLVDESKGTSRPFHDVIVHIT